MKKKQNTTIEELRDAIVEKGLKILEWKFIDAQTNSDNIGSMKEADGLPKGYHNFDHEALNSILNMSKPLLKDAQQIRQMEVKNESEVMKLLSTGKISINDGFRLLGLLKEKYEVEEKNLKLNMQRNIASSLKEDLLNDDD